MTSSVFTIYLIAAIYSSIPLLRTHYGFEIVQNAPEGSIILLHGCAHNPTGIDPTPDQWEKIADLIQQKNHMAFFDVAYQVISSFHLRISLQET